MVRQRGTGARRRRERQNDEEEAYQILGVQPGASAEESGARTAR